MANEISKKTEEMRETLASQFNIGRKSNYETLKKYIEFYQKASDTLRVDIEEQERRGKPVDIKEEDIQIQELVSPDTVQNWCQKYIVEYYNEFYNQIHRRPVEDINQLWEIQVKRVEIGNEKAVYVALCCDVMDQYILAARIEKNPYDIGYRELLEDALNNSERVGQEHIVIHSNMNPYVNVKGVSELTINSNINYKIIKDYQGESFYSNEVLEEIVEKISALEDISIIKADIFRKQFLKITSMHNSYYDRVEFWYLTRGQFRTIRKAVKELSMNTNVITTSDRLEVLSKQYI